eukprot:jgi/Bigna1/79290/fgenesh1_pg.61_\
MSSQQQQEPRKRRKRRRPNRRLANPRHIKAIRAGKTLRTQLHGHWSSNKRHRVEHSQPPALAENGIEDVARSHQSEEDRKSAERVQSLENSGGVEDSPNVHSQHPVENSRGVVYSSNIRSGRSRGTIDRCTSTLTELADMKEGGHSDTQRLVSNNVSIPLNNSQSVARQVQVLCAPTEPHVEFRTNTDECVKEEKKRWEVWPNAYDCAYKKCLPSKMDEKSAAAPANSQTKSRKTKRKSAGSFCTMKHGNGNLRQVTIHLRGTGDSSDPFVLFDPDEDEERGSENGKKGLDRLQVQEQKKRPGEWTPQQQPKNSQDLLKINEGREQDANETHDSNEKDCANSTRIASKQLEAASKKSKMVFTQTKGLEDEVINWNCPKCTLKNMNLHCGGCGYRWRTRRTPDEAKFFAWMKSKVVNQPSISLEELKPVIRVQFPNIRKEIVASTYHKCIEESKPLTSIIYSWKVGDTCEALRDGDWRPAKVVSVRGPRIQVIVEGELGRLDDLNLRPTHTVSNTSSSIEDSTKVNVRGGIRSSEVSTSIMHTSSSKNSKKYNCKGGKQFPKRPKFATTTVGGKTNSFILIGAPNHRDGNGIDQIEAKKGERKKLEKKVKEKKVKEKKAKEKQRVHQERRQVEVNEKDHPQSSKQYHPSNNDAESSKGDANSIYDKRLRRSESNSRDQSNPKNTERISNETLRDVNLHLHPHVHSCNHHRYRQRARDETNKEFREASKPYLSSMKAQRALYNNTKAQKKGPKEKVKKRRIIPTLISAPDWIGVCARSRQPARDETNKEFREASKPYLSSMKTQRALYNNTKAQKKGPKEKVKKRRIIPTLISTADRIGVSARVPARNPPLLEAVATLPTKKVQSIFDKLTREERQEINRYLKNPEKYSLLDLLGKLGRMFKKRKFSISSDAILKKIGEPVAAELKRIRNEILKEKLAKICKLSK